MLASLMDRCVGGILSGLFQGLHRLPAVWSARMMGLVGRIIGPHLPMSRIADTNLRLVYPHYTAHQRRVLIRACWYNIGCNIGEFPHLASLPHQGGSGPGWRIEGEHHLHDAAQAHRPIIFFSGHLGNWELMPLLVARYGLPFASIYRAPNNAFVDRVIRHWRHKNHESPLLMFPKGAKGARHAWRHMARGGHVGLLGDQKMNDGIATSFFGRRSMTASAAAMLALRFNALIITGHVVREGAATLVLKVDPPFDTNHDSFLDENKTTHIYNITQYLNNKLQSWIEESPENWLWFHRRWDKKLYKKNH